jgi:hypothetical protein
MDSGMTYGGEYTKAHPKLYLLFNSTHVSDIYFLEELPLKRNNLAQGNIPILNFHLSLFNDIMNIVRYEKPLYIILSTEDWNGSISTNLEPVGEEES